MPTQRPSFHHYSITQTLPVPPAKAFHYFTNGKNMGRFTPPWLGFKILAQSTPRLQKGTRLDYLMLFRGLPMHWRSRIEDWKPPHLFSYTLLSGPYSFFKHEHLFKPASPKGKTRMMDRLTFELPWALRHPFVEHLVKSDIRRIFEYRRDSIEVLDLRSLARP